MSFIIPTTGMHGDYDKHHEGTFWALLPLPQPPHIKYSPWWYIKKNCEYLILGAEGGGGWGGFKY